MIAKFIILCSVLATIVVAVPLSADCIFDRTIENCCTFPNETNEAETQMAMDDCDEEYGAKQDFKCAVECFLNKTKVMVDGKIDVVAASTLAKFTPEDEAVWNPILEEAATKCAEWAEAETEQTVESGCSMKAPFFVNCIMGQMFSNCPANIWKSDDVCDAAKTTVEKCRVLIIRPPPVHHH